MFAKENDISISTSTLLKIVLTVLILYFAWTIRDILILLLIAVTLASALEPLVDRLAVKKIPRSLIVLSVYIVAIGFIVLVGFAVVPAVIEQFKSLGDATNLAGQFQDKIANSQFLRSLNLTDLATQNVQTIINDFSSLSNNFVSSTLGFFSGVVQIVTVLVVSFYLLVEENGMKQFIYTLVPKEHNPKELHLVTRIQKKVGMWLVGQIIISALIFSLVLITLTLLGVKYALVIAIFSGFFELVPYIGPFISGLAALFFALLQGPGIAIMVGLVYVVISKVEGYILVPKIMQRTVGVSPLVILVGILIGFKVAGIFGVLLAVPLLAVINVVIEEWGSLRKAD